MAIEFKCLNCRNLLVADDDDAGEKTECDQCGIRVTIPSPIGGELTDRRLKSTTTSPPLSIRIGSKETKGGSSEQATAESSEADTGKQKSTDQQDATRKGIPKYLDQRFFDLENQPRKGFEFRVTFPEDQMHESSFETLVRSAATIRDRLMAHLETEPQYFERGSLVMVINRWRGDERCEDVNLRLVGLLNSLEVSHFFHSIKGGSANQLAPHFGLLGVLIARGLDHFRWKCLPRASLNRFHKRAIKSVVAELTTVVDELVERPITIGMRIKRLFARLF